MIGLLKAFLGLNLSKISNFIMIIVAFVAIFSTIWGYGKARDAKRYETALHDKEVEYVDKLGRKVTEVARLEITNSELKTLSKRDSAKLSAYERKLLQVYKELEANKRKLRNTESALLFAEKTVLDFATKFDDLKDSSGVSLGIKRAYYKTVWTEQEFIYNPVTDSMYVRQVSENEFFIDIFRKRKLGKNGEPVFWGVRFLKSWEYKASIKSLNDSTVIKEAVVVNMKK